MAPTFGSLVAGFLVLAVIFTVIERRWPAIRGQRLFRRGFGADLVYWFFTPLLTRTAGRVAVIAAVVVLALLAGAPLRPGGIEAWLAGRRTLVGSLPVPLQALGALILLDFVGYWTHRLFHRGRLWRFHAVHHASTDLDWLSSVRLHPVNEMIARVAQAAPLVLLGFHPGVLAGAVPLLSFYALLLHANVSWSFGPLRYVIASPVFHRWHHAAEEEGLDKNFAGLLPLWDLLFGTFHMPEGRLPARFGVAGEPVPEGVLAQLAYPFRGAAVTLPAAAAAPRPR